MAYLGKVLGVWWSQNEKTEEVTVEQKPKKATGRPRKYEKGSEPWVVEGVPKQVWYARRPLLAEIERLKVSHAEVENVLKAELEHAQTRLDAELGVANAELVNLRQEVGALTADRDRLTVELAAATAEITELKDQKETIPLNERTLGLLRLAGVKSLDALHQVLALPEAEFGRTMLTALERKRIETEAVATIQAMIEQQGMPNV